MSNRIGVKDYSCKHSLSKPILARQHVDVKQDRGKILVVQAFVFEIFETRQHLDIKQDWGKKAILAGIRFRSLSNPTAPHLDVKQDWGTRLFLLF